MPRHLNGTTSHGSHQSQAPEPDPDERGGGLFRILGTAADFVPVVGDVKALAFDAPREFSRGNVGMGLLSLASVVPGVPSVRQARTVGRAARGLFEGLEGLRKAGLRVFAKAEAPGIRRVVSITPNPKPGGAVKASIFEDVAGKGENLLNVEEFANIDEAVEAVSGGRGFFKGFKEIPVGPRNVMEGRFERIAERGLFPRSATRARAAARKRPGSVGGFLDN